jgi:dienelactone hydrolase
MATINYDRPIDLTVNIQVPDATIEADWSVPPAPRGAIIIANGTGNSRLARRNREIARRLYDGGFAILLVDLLTAEEEEENTLTGALRLDVNLFTERLQAAIHWTLHESGEGYLPIGILASGTASAAAVITAAREPELVKVIVSRGGRPDLAGIDLHRVIVPTLLIVGNSDTVLYELNRWALRRLNGEKHLVVIPGDAQAFEEKKALDMMCRVAMQWFENHMPSPKSFQSSKTIFDITWTPGRNTPGATPA